MKKIRYPFDLHGTLSIQYRDKVNPIFLDTNEENQSIIDIDYFAVRAFSYECGRSSIKNLTTKSGKFI